jgi:hypothetical protein
VSEGQPISFEDETIDVTQAARFLHVSVDAVKFGLNGDVK